MVKRLNQTRDEWLKLGNRDDVKKVFIVVQYLGDPYVPELPFATAAQRQEFGGFVAELKKEMMLICALLYSKEIFAEERRAADDEKEEGTNINASFLSLVLQRRENDICNAIAEFFKKQKREVGTRIYDGCLIERSRHGSKELLDPQLIRGAQDYVMQQTRFSVTLVEKSLEPTDEDLKVWTGEKDIERMAPFERLTYVMSRYAKMHNGLARMGECVMEPHPKIVGVYQPSGLLKNEWINERLRDDRVFKESNRMNDLLKWWDLNDNVDFPIIAEGRSDRYLVAFSNDQYVDLRTMQVYTLAQFTQQYNRSPVTFHWYDAPYTPALIDLPTPSWDKLINTQFDQYEGLAPFFEVMVGRLLLPTRLKDNWQIMMMLIGDANTGKSTIIEAIQKLFPQGSVAPITANQEVTFGLQGMEKKRLLIFPDIPAKLSKILDQTTFQSMVSGDPVSVAVKNEAAVKLDRWQVPLLMAGNYWPDYNDSSGSISRRYAAFALRVLVTDRDTQLMQKLEKEIPTILTRCVTRYHEKVAQDVKKVDIWKLMPQALIDMQDEVKEQTNPLQRFLTNGSFHYEVMYEDGTVTSLADFQSAYRGYCTAQKIDYQWKYDYYPFKSKGYVVEDKQVCKTCGNPALKGCCSKYDAKNRKKVVCIKNMRLQPKGAGSAPLLTD